MDGGMDGLISIFRFLEEEILCLFCILLKNTIGTRKHSGSPYLFFEQKNWVSLSNNLAIGQEPLGRTEVKRRLL